MLSYFTFMNIYDVILDFMMLCCLDYFNRHLFYDLYPSRIFELLRFIVNGFVVVSSIPRFL